MLKIEQVYYCVVPSCRLFKKHIHSWLTPDDAARMLPNKHLQCEVCKNKLKWVRSQAMGIK